MKLIQQQIFNEDEEFEHVQLNKNSKINDMKNISFSKKYSINIIHQQSSLKLIEQQIFNYIQLIAKLMTCKNQL